MNNRRKPLPSAVRTAVWNNFAHLFNERCFVGCGEPITKPNFECGHIVPSCKGGKDIIQNLRPICSNCNKSMGSKNMIDFVTEYGFNSPLNTKVRIPKKQLGLNNIINVICTHKIVIQKNISIFDSLASIEISPYVEALKPSDVNTYLLITDIISILTLNSVSELSCVDIYGLRNVKEREYAIHKRIITKTIDVLPDTQILIDIETLFSSKQLFIDIVGTELSVNYAKYKPKFNKLKTVLLNLIKSSKFTFDIRNLYQYKFVPYAFDEILEYVCSTLKPSKNSIISLDKIHINNIKKIAGLFGLQTNSPKSVLIKELTFLFTNITKYKKLYFSSYLTLLESTKKNFLITSKPILVYTLFLTPQKKK